MRSHPHAMQALPGSGLPWPAVTQRQQRQAVQQQDADWTRLYVKPDSKTITGGVILQGLWNQMCNSIRMNTACWAAVTPFSLQAAASDVLSRRESNNPKTIFRAQFCRFIVFSVQQAVVFKAKYNLTPGEKLDTKQQKPLTGAKASKGLGTGSA